MGMNAKVKNALSIMCVVYTIIISAMFAVGWALSDSAALFVPTPSKALLILLFSAILGFASLLLRRDGTGAARFIIHYIVCLASFVLVFVAGGGFPLAGKTSIMAMVGFTVIYAVVMGMRAIMCRRQGKASTKSKEEYNSVFK